MKNYNNLQQSRNLLVFEKLLKNINVNPNKILLKEVLVDPFKVLRLLATGKGPIQRAMRGLGQEFLSDISPQTTIYNRAGKRLTTMEEVEKALEVYDDNFRLMNKADLLNQLASDNRQRFQQAIERIVSIMEQDKIASKGTIVEFLKDPNVPLEKKNAFLDHLSKGDLEKADIVKQSIGIGPNQTVLPKLTGADLRAIIPTQLIGSTKWNIINPAQHLRRLYTYFKQYRNWYESISDVGLALSPELRIVRNIVKLEGGTEEEINKRILQLVIGEAEYEKVVDSIIGTPSGAVGPGAIARARRAAKDIKYEEILRKVESSAESPIYRARITQIQDSLHDHFKELEIKIGKEKKFLDKFQENYEQAISSSDPAIRAAALNKYAQAMHALGSGAVQWLAPYEKTKIGLLPLILKVFTKGKMTEVGPLTNWLFNIFIVGPTLEYVRNLLYEMRQFAEGWTEQHTKLKKELEIEEQRLKNELDGLPPDKVNDIENNIEEAKQQVTQNQAFVSGIYSLGRGALWLYYAPGFIPRKIGQYVTTPALRKLGSLVTGRDIMEPEVAAALSKKTGEKWNKFYELQKLSLGLTLDRFTASRAAAKDPEALAIQKRIDDLKEYIKTKEEEYEPWFKLRPGSTTGFFHDFPQTEFEHIFREYIKITVDMQRFRAKKEAEEAEQQKKNTPTTAPAQAPAAPEAPAGLNPDF